MIHSVEGASLASLLAGIVMVDPIYDRHISALFSDSRQIKPGSLFLAYPGEKHDARQFISDAISKGAIAILSEADQVGVEERGRIPIFYIPNVQSQIAKIAARFYGLPSRRMIITGITGTNGKTSTSHFIAKAYAALAKPCAVIGTVGNGLPDSLQPSTHTTPDPISLQQQFRAWLDADITHVAMEVSSHALDQQRVKHVEFTTAVFTNLTRDHLDYHGSFEEYGLAKRKLFELFGLKHAVLNADDPFSAVIRAAIAPGVEVVTYGTCDNADVKASAIQLHSEGLYFQCESPWGKGEIRVPIYGFFNVGNILAALATLCVQGVPFADALIALRSIHGVPGRMQLIQQSGFATAVVDYAHTPDALEKALLASRAHCQGQLWCVFGCGGDRDPGKRPMMAQMAEQQADRIIVTDDNPRTEDAKVIVQGILQGFAASTEVLVEHDRKKAIESALAQAAPGDVVLIAGKGHEDYQIIGEHRAHFSDVEVVNQYFVR